MPIPSGDFESIERGTRATQAAEQNNKRTLPMRAPGRGAGIHSPDRAQNWHHGRQGHARRPDAITRTSRAVRPPGTYGRRRPSVTMIVDCDSAGGPSRRVPPALNITSPNFDRERQWDMRRLLVVEDELLLAEQMAQTMENLGWAVMGPARSLDEAEALIAGRDPDVALLDVNIGGQSVFPLADVLHRRRVPIVFCSGYDLGDEVDRFTGCARLRKPVGIHQMYAAVNGLLDYSRTAIA